LSEVPEHWGVKHLKFTCEFITQKVPIGEKKVIVLENIESWSGKYINTDSGED
jgi:type I restriction enzyme S subunit